MTTHTPSQKAAGAVMAGVILVAAVAFALDRAGVDVKSWLPKPSATGAAGPREPGKSTKTRAARKHRVTLHRRANLPGTRVTSFTLRYLERVAEIYGGDLVVSYGTAGNHVKRSFHYAGHAADIGMLDNGLPNDSEGGTRIMAACLVMGGVAPAKARQMAERGGSFDLLPRGRAVECIWRAPNHYDHVHIAVAPR